ncbi:MAG: LPP20 family lipoprotein [Spirochaetaceae bacterium]|jgi:ABC-type antimicrobial peptide transport system permease subunit|nr:LPP20 family lipoprotein [Spirochaetaceae bacterium]
MRKILCICALFTVFGCASKPKTIISPDDPKDVPEFVTNPPQSETEIYGFGSARLNNSELARQTAEARARRAIANNLSIQVQGMLTDYAREAGTINNSASLQLVENVGREVINVKLSGVKILKRQLSKSGTWWVLASYSKDAAKNELANVIENEASRYADFKAKEALKMLDEQLDKQQTILTVDRD